MKDRSVRAINLWARSERKPDTDTVLAKAEQLEAVPEQVKRARPPRERRPRPTTDQQAYAMGRAARRTGRGRDANPFIRPEQDRTSSNDMLKYRWDAGWDFEVC
ncbi:MAG: hypothetical protein KY467_01150 [Gemmatimonadetes bacterium]|nr:hypothetical protein [Gemmatimonadota bacterium]